ncbi:ExbD/TolR family protein [Halorhodospira halochloris]|uniref:ExbD/TolR family protein n=1 Tax=Halorhodospira halochloris TaxID=1052 RepID=UPI001EE7A588|nr:biopolymer transporter ExbD [Halorhodospira halochloris]MCG5548228.1 biopolymer transporter ExbD [Halorhodospira halochloris]
MQIEQPQRRRRLVSLTPLIDVVFILLIFFMLASTFVDQHIFSVDAPAQDTAATQEDDVQPLRIRVDEDGYRVDEQLLDRDAVMEKLHDLAADEDEPRVQVLAVAEAPVRAVIKLIDWSAGAGIEDVAVIREE